MMELVKKHIHMNRRSGSVASQMTLDDDFNVPDTMEDCLLYTSDAADD